LGNFWEKLVKSLGATFWCARYDYIKGEVNRQNTLVQDEMRRSIVPNELQEAIALKFCTPLSAHVTTARSADAATTVIAYVTSRDVQCT